MAFFSIYKYFLENNNTMRFNGLFEIYVVVIIVLFILSTIILKSKLNITFLSQINNADINIKLNITYLFKLININIQLYPRKERKKKRNTSKHNKSKGGNEKQLIKEIYNILNIVKDIHIEEFYSKIEFGSEIIEFTCFIYLFINIIYGNLVNIINPSKVYLSVNPDFTQNYIRGNIKIHTKLSFKNIRQIFIFIYRIYKQSNKKYKEDIKNESNRFDKKSYGDNS